MSGQAGSSTLPTCSPGEVGAQILPILQLRRLRPRAWPWAPRGWPVVWQLCCWPAGWSQAGRLPSPACGVATALSGGCWRKGNRVGRHSTAATRDEAQSLFNCFLCERSEGRARLEGGCDCAQHQVCQIRHASRLLAQHACHTCLSGREVTCPFRVALRATGGASVFGAEIRCPIASIRASVSPFGPRTTSPPGSYPTTLWK